MILIVFCLANLLCLNPALSDDAKDFAKSVYDLTLKSDYSGYLKLLHPKCKAKAFTQKSFMLRGHVLKSLKAGVRIEAKAIADYRDFRIKLGDPYKETYSIEPSHVVLVWGTHPTLPDGRRVELNPIVLSEIGWKILDGTCIASVQR